MKKWDDSGLIREDTVSLYANTNEKFLTGPVKGIVLELPGLDGGSCLGGTLNRQDYEAPHAKRFGEKGILLAYLFPGPWSWGNAAAVRMGDGVAAALKRKYQLDEDAPVAVCGGSMGGMGALNYGAYSNQSLAGAAAACPCVDVPACFACHPDFPRTYISAVAAYDMPLEEGLRRISPMELAEQMPPIPYFICNDGADEVFPEEQCDRYVDKLRALGHQVEYHPQPGLKHGEFFPEVREALHCFLERCILGG